MIKIYRKTATIEAEQFNYEKWVYMRQDAYPMVFGDTAKDGGMMATNPFIKTLEGNMKIKDSDWIATGVNGEHWAIADDVFKKTHAELPVIPKAVADWINKCKHDGIAIASAMDEDKFPKKVADYFRTYYTRDQWVKLQDTFARAWLDGYIVEEEHD